MRKYGLIGKKISYSFSKIIHEKLFEIYNIDAQYELIETNNLDKELLLQYDGVNITIPYKQEVIPFLDENNCPFASCNTIKNQSGYLEGYNTDIAGFDYMLKKLKLKTIDKIVLLGSGASSKMLQYYFKDKEIIVISRTNAKYNYESLVNMKADILINATPVGMAEYKSPIPEEIVSNFKAILDLNYNPLNSQLAHFCQRQGVPFINGLYMLVEQAIKAFEIWQNKKVNNQIFNNIYCDVCSKVFDKVAVIGMPLAGKTTMIRKMNGIDLDDVIEEKSGSSIPALLEKGIFRGEETKTLKFLVEKQEPLIALGGGAILKHENVELLKDYLIVFLNTPIDILKERSKTNYRPLIQKEADLLRLYEQRYPIYQNVSNITLSSSELEFLLERIQK